MNYFKNLLGGSAQKLQPKQKIIQPKDYELSGEFQIIEPDEDQCEKSDQKQLNLETLEKQYNQAKQSNLINNIKSNNKQSDDSIQIVISQSTEKQKIKCQDIMKSYDVVQGEDSQQVNVQASTIKIDDYFMLVDNKDLNKQFSNEEQWHKFYQKVRAEADKHNKKCLSINYQELNSILSIQFQNYQRRTQYWNEIAKCGINLKSTKQLTNCKDLKKLQTNLQKILPTIQTILQNKHFIQNNILQKQQNHNKQQAYQPVNQAQQASNQKIKKQLQYVKSIVNQVLKLYGGNDPQIGYSKGLQYVALGTIISRPNCTIQQFKSDFKYLMFKKQLRNMFFPGTPKLYEEINLLQQCMQSQIPKIKQKIQQVNGDVMKLFIGYYKTFLLYKVTDVEVIVKIFQLLLIYGIDLVRIILIRIMSKKEDYILSIDNQGKLMTYLAQNLVNDYFKIDSQSLILQKEQRMNKIKRQLREGENKKSPIIQKFKNLFITKDIA